MKKIIALLLIFSFCITLFSCGKDDETRGEEEYVLPTAVVDSDISLPYTSADNFYPYSSKSSLNRDLLPIIYESLFVATKDGKGEALLAESAETKGKIITVKILKKVRFSDGSELNAQNVKSSYEKARTNAYYKDALSNIASVKVIDNYTIVFSLKKQDFMACNVLNFPICRQVGDKYLGTGKYSVAYIDDTPYLQVNTSHRNFRKNWNKQIALYDIAGITSPVYIFKANDITLYRNDLSSDDYINLSSKTVSQDMNNLVYVGINSQWKGSVTSIEWVRQAINIGLNRREIAASSFLGQGNPVVSPFRSEFYALDGENLADISGETEKAINILERNGYDKLNSNGVRTNGRNTLRVNILVCTKNEYKLSVAESVKKSLESLGFGVTITKKSTVSQFKEALKEGHFGLYIGEIELTDNYKLSEFFSNSGVVNYGIDKDFYTEYSDYRNGVISTTEFVESFSTEVPFIPLFYRKSVVSINPNVSGVDENNLYVSVCDWKILD